MGFGPAGLGQPRRDHRWLRPVLSWRGGHGRAASQRPRDSGPHSPQARHTSAQARRGTARYDNRQVSTDSKLLGCLCCLTSLSPIDRKWAFPSVRAGSRTAPVHRGGAINDDCLRRLAERSVLLGAEHAATSHYRQWGGTRRPACLHHHSTSRHVAPKAAPIPCPLKRVVRQVGRVGVMSTMMGPWTSRSGSPAPIHRTRAQCSTAAATRGANSTAVSDIKIRSLMISVYVRFWCNRARVHSRSSTPSKQGRLQRSFALSHPQPMLAFHRSPVVTVGTPRVAYDPGAGRHARNGWRISSCRRLNGDARA